MKKETSIPEIQEDPKGMPSASPLVSFGESSGEQAGHGPGSPPKLSRPPNLPRLDLVQGPREEYLRIGVPLYEASIKSDWKAAKAILESKPELLRYSITENGETPLHVAASAKGDPKRVEKFVKNLVGMMPMNDLELQNKNYSTALYLAACAGNIEAVKILVTQNRRLLTIPGASGMMPLYAAALFGKKDVVEYIYEQSSISDEDGWNPQNRGWLLEKCVENDMFDIALKIVQLEVHSGFDSGTVLQVLARKPEAFCETKSNIIGKTIKLIFTFTGLGGLEMENKALPLLRLFHSVFAFIGSNVGGLEMENKALPLLRIIWEDVAKKPKNEINKILRGPADSTKQEKSSSGRVVQAIQLQKLISEHLDKLEVATRNIIKGMSDPTTQDIKPPTLQLENLISEYLVQMHIASENIVKQNNKPFVDKGDQAQKLQKLISEHIVNMHDETRKIIKRLHGNEDQAHQHLQQFISHFTSKLRTAATLKESYSSRVLFIAAEMGNTRFLVELVRQYPDLIWKVDDNNQTIFHIAVKHRHEGIYNLLYEIGAMKDLIIPLKDRHENNMLHLVGTRAKQKQLENVPGVALQMQRELLWFQEVKNMIPPSYTERKNVDGLTPRELFSMEHEELITQGEKWLKETANQCMVVAALIATIVFAAAFTVPGGYDQTSGKHYGIPIFSSKATFIVFVVADAISLFMACATIFIFLSILTTRYAERDFLNSLPRRLILGLLTLFLSITTMTVTFGISFFVLYDTGLLWVPILICVVAGLLVLLYAKLQCALFIDVIISLYTSRSLFKPQKRVLYYESPTV